LPVLNPPLNVFLTMSSIGHMTEAEKKAEELRLKDAEILQRRKEKFDAARFAHIEKTNMIQGQPNPQPASEQLNWRNETDAKIEETKKRGWRIFKKKTRDSATELLKESTNPLPVPKNHPPIAARSIKPENIPVEMSPNWAGVDQQNQRPQPNVGHSSNANFPRPLSAVKMLTHQPQNPIVPPDPNKPMYETVGYGGRKPDTNISSTIAAFQAGLKPLTGKPRQMKKQNVVSCTSETMDSWGNITRTITRKITEPNGKTRSETEVIEIPAKMK